MICIDLGFFWFLVFWILYVLQWNHFLVESIQVLLFEDGTVQLVSAGAPQAFLYLVFGGYKMTLIGLWFFLDIRYLYASSDTVYFGRACAWVHSWCSLLLSVRLSFLLVTPIPNVMLWIDLPFWGFLSFWILYVLYRIDPLVDSVQLMLSDDGTVQLAGVSAPLGLLISCVWWPQLYFGRFVIFSGFVLPISMFRYPLFRASLCVSLL